MKKISVFALIILMLLGSQLVDAQRKTVVFNGKNLKEWYAFGEKSGKHNDVSDMFRVENRVFRFYGKEAGYMMSNQSFGEFKLTAEFRWNTDSTFVRKSKSINSGLMYLIPETAIDQLWPEGFQFQIKKGSTGDFVLLQQVTLEINGERTIAGKSETYKRTKDAFRPIGEWNKLEIIYKDGTILQKLNGKVVNEGKNPSVTSGRIALMYEGYPIDFRKVKITEYKK